MASFSVSRVTKLFLHPLCWSCFKNKQKQKYSPIHENTNQHNKEHDNQPNSTIYILHISAKRILAFHLNIKPGACSSQKTSNQRKHVYIYYYISMCVYIYNLSMYIYIDIHIIHNFTCIHIYIYTYIIFMFPQCSQDCPKMPRLKQLFSGLWEVKVLHLQGTEEVGGTL